MYHSFLPFATGSVGRLPKTQSYPFYNLEQGFRPAALFAGSGKSLVSRAAGKQRISDSQEDSSQLHINQFPPGGV
jgi:hypothetical protein